MGVVKTDKNSDAYKRINHYDKYVIDMSQVYYKKIIREVNRVYNKPLKMLDIGCFDGSLGENFIKQGWDVYGIEAHNDACDKASKKGLKVTKKDIEEGLPYAESFFDCVIAAEIIEHLYDTDKFLDEIKRLLKPSGLIIVTVPNIACFINRINILIGKYPRYCEYQAGTAGGHIRVYNKQAILKQLIEHNFKIRRCCGANFPLPMENKHIPLAVKNIAVKLGDFTPSIAGQILVAAVNLK